MRRLDWTIDTLMLIVLASLLWLAWAWACALPPIVIDTAPPDSLTPMERAYYDHLDAQEKHHAPHARR